MDESVRLRLERLPAPVVEAALTYFGVKALRLKFPVMSHMRHQMPRQFAKLRKQILAAGIKAAERNRYDFFRMLEHYEWLLGTGDEAIEWFGNLTSRRPARGHRPRLVYSSMDSDTGNGDNP